MKISDTYSVEALKGRAMLLVLSKEEKEGLLKLACDRGLDSIEEAIEAALRIGADGYLG